MKPGLLKSIAKTLNIGVEAIYTILCLAGIAIAIVVAIRLFKLIWTTNVTIR